MIANEEKTLVGETRAVGRGGAGNSQTVREIDSLWNFQSMGSI